MASPASATSLSSSMVEMTPLGAGEERGEVKIVAERCYNNLPLQQRFTIAINFNKRDLGLVCSS